MQPCPTVPAMGWNPWAALRSRPHIEFALADLPTEVRGVYARRARGAVILVATDLKPEERNAVLAHELIHDERGGGPAYRGQPKSWGPVVARDEGQVDNEVARRLVPEDELREVLRRVDDLGLGVTADQVARQFGVPPSVAERALMDYIAHSQLISREEGEPWQS